jgi:NADH:ubiquinone reductase (non-electrogenic)
MTTFKKLVITTVAVTVTTKAILITSNDEWGDLSYQLTTGLFQRSLPPEQKTKVVILGTGWAALSCLQKLDSKKVDVKIISPRSYFFYTPLLAGTATGTVCSTSIIEPIRWHLLRYGTNNFIQGECLGINFQKKFVQYSCGEEGEKGGGEGGVHELPYDHLVIAVGAQPATFNIPGVQENAIFMKEIENGIMVQHKILEILERANGLLLTGESEEKIKHLLHWIVIGGGPTGVELTAELNDFIRNDVQKYFPHLLPFIRVTLLEATGKILGMFDPKISNYAQETLTKQGASVLCNSAVVKMTEDSVEIKKGQGQGQQREGIPEVQFEKLNYGMVVWAGGITARPITQKIARLIGGEQVPMDGRPIRGLLVGDKFQVKGVPSPPSAAAGGAGVGAAGGPCVWSIGDCALSGCPPTAQAAFQQGNYLGRMLRDTNFDPRLIAEYPSFTMTHYGAMAYLGASQGVAELKGMLWDRYPVTKEPNENTIVEGTGAFALWRSLYFSRLLSNRNKAQVIFDWFKASVFGRDISSPFVRPSPQLPPPPLGLDNAAADHKLKNSLGCGPSPSPPS